MIRVFLGTILAVVAVMLLGLIALAAGGANSLNSYLILAAILFSIGMFGFLARRNAIPLVLEPSRNRRFDDRFTERGDFDGEHSLHSGFWFLECQDELKL